MTVLAELEMFARSVRERLFAPGSAEARRVGLEIEMIPLLAADGAPCPLEGDDLSSPATLTFIREFGARRGWRERRSGKGAPYFGLPNGWTLTFEPGGQVELCTTPTTRIGALVAEVRSLVTALRAVAADEGIALACVGIDPHNDSAALPLQVVSERYVKMAEYFESIGPAGARMMRQTAATQVSLDGGDNPGWRWRLLADAAPYLTALFANSPRHAGRETGWVSFRERCWRQLDPTRTGVPHPELPACDAYTRFALDAVDMTRTSPEGCYRPFAEWVDVGDWNETQWESHLTTLFPEVRPRGYLEVRSIDALPPELLSLPVVLLAGLAYDTMAGGAARDLLAGANEDLLNRAARCGLRDPDIERTALALAEIGLRGARSLGEAVIGGAELDLAEDWVREWSARGRSPADSR
jgi:glutamate--cysteine ligase